MNKIIKYVLYDILRSDYGREAAEAHETIEPVILTPEECQQLGVTPHTTALLTRRITTDVHGVVVALGQVLLRGDRSRYLFRRTVDEGLGVRRSPGAPRAPQAPAIDLSPARRRRTG